MDKLSGIIPTNSRIKSVDLAEAKPRRPGAPSYGIPMGVNTIKDRVTLGMRDKNSILEDTMTYRNPKEMKNAKIAEDLTSKFFDTRLDKPKAAPVAEVVNEVVAEAAVPELDFSEQTSNSSS